MKPQSHHPQTELELLALVPLGHLTNWLDENINFNKSHKILYIFTHIMGPISQGGLSPNTKKSEYMVSCYLKNTKSAQVSLNNTKWDLIVLLDINAEATPSTGDGDHFLTKDLNHPSWSAVDAWNYPIQYVATMLVLADYIMTWVYTLSMHQGTSVGYLDQIKMLL
ncbi:hypothetical protein BYT27DRAFT_7213616 [Phlegmacium glaucopus]|nr:hypothetical protein BYT27DRAFT_7213616 [Phlegmacium glaucopus]